jgi:hypothetical protein
MYPPRLNVRLYTKQQIFRFPNATATLTDSFCSTFVPLFTAIILYASDDGNYVPCISTLILSASAATVRVLE